jgi:hypothetical protein
MLQTRPTAILVIGVGNLLMGLIGVVWNGCGTVSVVAEKKLSARWLTAEQQAEQAAIERVLVRKVPLHQEYQLVVRLAVPWVLTLMLLVSGVGLLRLSNWGRILAIFYAVFSLLHKMVMGVYTIAFLLPFYTDIFATMVDPRRIDVSVAAETPAIISLVVTPFLLTLYPIAVLLLVNRTAVVEALQAPRPVELEPAV